MEPAVNSFDKKSYGVPFRRLWNPSLTFGNGCRQLVRWSIKIQLLGLAPCSNRPSRISTTFCGKRPAAPRSSTTPSRPPGCCSSNIWTIWSGPTNSAPSWRARPTAHHRQGPPLVGLGRAEEDGRHVRSRQGADRRRPDRLRQRELFPYLQGFQHPRRGPEHDRIQDRRDLRRDQKQVPERLFAARRAGADRRAAASARRQEKHELSHLYEAKHQEHGQRRAQRRRILHAAPAHPRHDPGGQAADRRAHL